MGPATALAGATGIVVASVLPWVRSGSATRSSYELVRTAERLELVDGAAATVAQGWYLVPLIVAGAWVAALIGRWRWVASLALLAGGAAVALAAVSLRSPLPTLLGPVVAGAAAMVTAVGAVATLWERGRP